MYSAKPSHTNAVSKMASTATESTRLPQGRPIASGVAHFNLLVFGLASLATRGVRFFLVAALLRLFGEPIREFIERYLTWVTTGFVALIIGGFAALKYL